MARPILWRYFQRLDYKRHSRFSVKIHRRCHANGYGGSSKINTLAISPRNLRSSRAMQIALCCCSSITSANQSSGVICFSPQGAAPSCGALFVLLRCDKFIRDQFTQEFFHRAFGDAGAAIELNELEIAALMQVIELGSPA